MGVKNSSYCDRCEYEVNADQLHIVNFGEYSRVCDKCFAQLQNYYDFLWDEVIKDIKPLIEELENLNEEYNKLNNKEDKKYQQLFDLFKELTNEKKS